MPRCAKKKLIRRILSLSSNETWRRLKEPIRYFYGPGWAFEDGTFIEPAHTHQFRIYTTEKDYGVGLNEWPMGYERPLDILEVEVIR